MARPSHASGRPGCPCRIRKLRRDRHLEQTAAMVPPNIVIKDGTGGRGVARSVFRSRRVKKLKLRERCAVAAFRPALAGTHWTIILTHKKSATFHSQCCTAASHDTVTVQIDQDRSRAARRRLGWTARADSFMRGF